MATVVAITLGYFLLGVLGLTVAVSPGYSTIIWPASGLALVAALFYPRQAWIGVFLGSFLVNVGVTWQNTQTLVWLLPICIGFGAALQSFVGAYLIRRFVGIPFRFHCTRLVLRFIALAAVLSTLISATIGSSALLLFGTIQPEVFMLSWVTWWAGGMIGVLVLVPWIVVIFPRLFGNDFEHPWRLLAGFLFVLLVTAFLSWGSTYSEWNKQNKEFRSNAQLLEVLLNNRIKNSVDMLYGFVGLVNSSEHIEVDEFNMFADSIRQRDDSILTVSLNFAVTGDDLDRFEANIQQEYPSIKFQVTEKNAQGDLVPVTPRPRHTPVTYISPMAGNEVVLGYDIYSQPERRFAVDQAITGRQVYPTAPLKLVQNGNGVLLFLPFFHQQSDAFLGMATAVLELETLTDTIVEYGLLPNTELYLIDDHNATSTPIIVAKSKQATFSADEVIRKYLSDEFKHAVSFDIQVGAKTWRLFQVSESDFFKQPWVVKFVLACGFLFSGVFGWFLLIVSSHSAVLEHRVALRTQDLLQANEELTASELAQSQAKEQAQQASKAKSAFLATMSHEIRTPLNGTIGCLSLLLNTKLQPEQATLAKLSQQSAESLLDIINDILDLSKIEVGRFELEKQAFSLPTLIEEVTNVFVLKAEEKGIVLNSPAVPVPDISLLGDRLRIKQILVNLLGNAVKFTQEGEVSLFLSVTPLDEDSVVLNILIKDTGIGISSDSQTHLFQRFNQADSSTTRRFGGTGLGLAISKEFIDAMEGSIELTSDQGQGSTFTVRIPLTQLTPATEPKSVSADVQVAVLYQNATGRAYLGAVLDTFGVPHHDFATLAQACDALSGISTNTDKTLVALVDEEIVAAASRADLIQWNAVTIETNTRCLILQGRSHLTYDQQAYVTSLTKPVFQGALLKALETVLFLKKPFEEISETQIQTQKEPVMIPNSANAATADRPTFHGNVLLVEDNLTNQIVARGLLKLFGVEAAVAKNGQIAVDLARETRFDLIFMDCQMPVMDGYEATRIIRQSTEGATPSDVPIVALSANAMKGDEDECIAAGMNDHIAKPISQDKLSAVLSQWLA
ncbi:CHASE domain-containing protein [Marinomonas vulgaris]|nr:CHASE domain-containing protein [Marinomonas vulgaris]